MAGRAKLERVVRLTAETFPQVMGIVNDVRFAVVGGAPLSTVLMHLDELAEVLLDVEALVGVETPAALFEGEMTELERTAFDPV